MRNSSLWSSSRKNSACGYLQCVRKCFSGDHWLCLTHSAMRGKNDRHKR